MELLLLEDIVRAENDKIIQREKRKKQLEIHNTKTESEYYFAFTAGYASGRVFYEITWEEIDQMAQSDEIDKIM